MSAAIRKYQPGYASWATLIVGGLLIWSLWAIDASPERLARLPAQLGTVLGFFWPVDWHYGHTRVVPAIIESIQLAWIGTIIGALISLPLTVLGASTLFPWCSRVIKGISASIRAVPEILWAIYLVPIVGLGPFAGALALGINSVGMLSKLGSEVVESADLSAMQAVEAAGGSRLVAIRLGLLPQVLPELMAHWLFRFELNLRASAVLGVVGAGGVGGLLLNTLRYRQFEMAAAVLVLTVLAVLAIDLVSGSIRRRLLRGG